MHLRILRLTLLLFTAPLLLAVMACGGDGGDAAEGSAVAAGEVTLASPDQLTSFRYTLMIEVSGAEGDESAPLAIQFSMELSGAVITPDREQSTTKVDFGFFKIESETIRIGDQSWTRESGGEWEEDSAAGDVLPLDFAASPIEILGGSEFSSLQQVIAGLSGTAERVNGVDAVRYDLTAEQFAQAFPDQGDGDGLSTANLDDLTVSLWVARDSGIPVRLVLEGLTTGDDSGGSVKIELNLTDLNASSITIEPPI